MFQSNSFLKYIFNVVFSILIINVGKGKKIEENMLKKKKINEVEGVKNVFVL